MPKHKGHVVDRWGQCRAPNVRKYCPTCEAEHDGFIDYPMETYRHPDGHDVTLRVCVWRCAACRATTTTEDVPARVLGVSNSPPPVNRRSEVNSPTAASADAIDDCSAEATQ